MRWPITFSSRAGIEEAAALDPKHRKRYGDAPALALRALPESTAVVDIAIIMQASSGSPIFYTE
jgi:hypothetical protein